MTGFLSSAGVTVAAYFVTWTVGAVASHGANFDFIVGSWGERATADDRAAVALEFRIVEGRPQFMVRDSRERPMASSGLATKTLSRPEVIGTALAQQTFEMVDAVWLFDPRITEITGA